MRAFQVFFALVVLAGCSEEKIDVDMDAAKRGETISAACGACHNLMGSFHKIGPSLEGIVGRKAGTAEGYQYSKAMKQSGITWTPEQLTLFIRNPTKVVPGTKMAFGEISEADTRDLVEYLKTL